MVRVYLHSYVQATAKLCKQLADSICVELGYIANPVQPRRGVILKKLFFVLDYVVYGVYVQKFMSLDPGV